MYKGVFSIFHRYWRTYGQTRAMLRSFYLHSAIAMTVLCFPLWRAGGWWDVVLAVLPSLLGFTLGGFAIFIGFGSEKFRELIVKETEEDIRAGKPSIYESLCATFVHFIVVQICALIFALLQKAWSMEVVHNAAWQSVLPYINAIGGFVGYALFAYSVTLTLAACMHVFRIAMDYSFVTNAALRDKVEQEQASLKNRPL